MVFTTRLSGGRGGRNGLANELRRRGIKQSRERQQAPSPASGCCTMTLAAARDDQFLVEHDLHETAAPMGGLLRNRDHHDSDFPSL
jgi:hypothetical protein